MGWTSTTERVRQLLERAHDHRAVAGDLFAVALTGDAEEWPDWFPRRDAELACELDRFAFALPVVREDGLLIARPVFG